MKKSNSLILMIAALFAVCGLYYGVRYFTSKMEAEESAEEEVVMLTEFEASDISSMSFNIDKNEEEFVKNDSDQWTLKSDSCFPVDGDILDQAATSVSNITVLRTIDNVSDLNQYGLDNPSNTIYITMDDGSDVTIKIGNLNNDLGQYYVLKDDDDETVYLIKEDSVSDFNSSLYDYAKSETFPYIESTSINYVSVESQDTEYSICKDDSTGLWSVTSLQYTEEKADTVACESLSSNISSAAYASFVDYYCEESELVTYGLDNPYATFTIDYTEEIETSEEESDQEESSEEQASDQVSSSEDLSEDDSNDAASTEQVLDGEASEEDTDQSQTELVDKQLIVYIGDLSDSEHRYIRVNTSDQIYTISTETLDSFLSKNIENFWDLSYSYVAKDDISSITVDYKDLQYDIYVSRETSEDDDGQIVTTSTYTMNDIDLDENLFDTFFTKLSTISAQKRVLDNPDQLYPSASRKKDDSDNISFYINKKDGSTLKVSYDEKNTNFYSARVNDDTQYLVNKMTVKELIASFKQVAGISE